MDAQVYANDGDGRNSKFELPDKRELQLGP